MQLDIEQIISQMTLEEKAGLCSGIDFWHTKKVERLGIPDIMVSDGPHGLRKQEEQTDHLGLSQSVTAVCYPSGAGLCSSFDRSLMNELGQYLGETAAAERVHTLLGPAINIKRSPLCGRNFEYLSEDPYVAGEMSAAYVKGLQSQKVGASVKHFAANNQEYRRMSIDVDVSQRALREIYLPAFEKTVKEANPWSMMCSYNRINGTYSCENKWLLTDVLRKEWGFDGVVMTDWGAMNCRPEALKAGLELEMPSSNGENDKRIIEAVRDGRLSEEDLNEAVRRLLQWISKGCSSGEARRTYDIEKQHAFARKAAGETAVLLKNTGLLPLQKGVKVAFIGGFAQTPRYQGGGSSHINSYKVTNVLEAAEGMAEIIYAEGFSAEGDEENAAEFAKAVEAAKSASCAVIFAGLPDCYESEGYDRVHMDLPACQNELINRIVSVQPNTIVVLQNGSPVTMPWISQVGAVLELYLGGEAVSEAAVDLLFGDVNPSGKLAETFPLRLQDTPSYLDFPGNHKTVTYSEDIYVGYRWYDSREMDVLFPFGHGLSYTSFDYTDITVDQKLITDNEGVTVKVTVKNVGNRAGKEVVQLYVEPKNHCNRPLRELKGFQKVFLLPNEEQEVTFYLEKRSFAYFEEQINDWFVSEGTYVIRVGTSSRDLPLSSEVFVKPEISLPFIVDDTTTVGDVLASERSNEQIWKLIEKSGFAPSQETGERLGDGTDQLISEMLDGLPLHSLVSFGKISWKEIRDLEDILRRI